MLITMAQTTKPYYIQSIWTLISFMMVGLNSIVGITASAIFRLYDSSRDYFVIKQTPRLNFNWIMETFFAFMIPRASFFKNADSIFIIPEGLTQTNGIFVFQNGSAVGLRTFLGVFLTVSPSFLKYSLTII